ncbi:MAG: GNAT family N-acetyltransferase [Oscillospiraceae bacterium]
MPTLQGTQPLQTARLLLRPFTRADAHAMYANWAANAEVTRYLAWLPHQTLAETRALLKLWEKETQNPETCNWCIALKQPGGPLPIGSIGVVKLNNALAQAEVGYCLGTPWWGRGLAAEALAAVKEYLFGCGIRRLEARHHTQNPASGRVMEKCGLAFEGVLRSAARDNLGRFCDVALYAAINPAAE